MSYDGSRNRPYQTKKQKALLKAVISPETSDWHYNKHHKGYVAALNTIEKALETADRGAANGNYTRNRRAKAPADLESQRCTVARHLLEVMAAMAILERADVVKAIEKEFGSFDKWRQDFKAAAFSAKLSGWGLLVIDQLYYKRLLNVLVDEHQYGAIWGGIPLIALDVFEHAYYHKDGPGRALYIDNFIDHLHWERINKRYLQFVK
jgi:Fe-Mn family superoxide dismutase